MWSAAHVLNRSITVNSPIIDAKWTFFSEDNNNSAQCLAVLHEERLNIYNIKTGQKHSLALPHRMKALWPLQRGLLLERDKESSFYREEDDEEPIMLSLLHPIDELKPVSYQVMLEGKSSTMEGLVCQSELDVVYASKEIPLLVVYDKAAGKHVFWKIQAILPEDERTYDMTVHEGLEYNMIPFEQKKQLNLKSLLNYCLKKGMKQKASELTAYS